MADEQPTAPAEEQDTSTSAPESEGHAPEADSYEERYNNLRSEFDRRNQVWSELGEPDEVRQAIEFRDQLQSDPEVQQALYQQLQELYGEQPDEDVEDTSGLDPEVLQYLQDMNQRLEQTEQLTQAQQEDAQLAQMDEHVSGTLDGLKEQEGLDLSEEDDLDILRLAVTLDPTPEGMPDVAAGLELWKQGEARRYERYIKTKKAPSAPKGQTSSEQLDMTDDRVRREHMAERYEAMEQD